MRKKALLLSAFFLGALIAMGSFLAFDPDDFVAFDTLVGNIAHPFQTLFGAEVFLSITVLGSVTGALCSVVLAFLFLRSECGLLLRYAAALISAMLLSTLLKYAFMRVRPPNVEWVMKLHSYSFPSGHATTAMVIFGFLGYVAYRHLGGLWAKLLAILCPVIILFVGASRIILGYHFASDVLAGYMLGGLSISLVFLYPLSSRERRYLKI